MERQKNVPEPLQERDLKMGSAVLLTVSRVEDPTRIINALDDSKVAFFPRSSEDSPETTLEVDGRRYYGEADIMQNMADIAATARTER